jgi:hypothetical protein
VDGAPAERAPSGPVPVNDLTDGEPPDAFDLAGLAERLVMITIGGVWLATEAIARAASSSQDPTPVGSPVGTRPDLDPIARAAVTVALRSVSLVTRVGVGLVRGSVRLTTTVADRVGVSPLIQRVAERLAGLDPAATEAPAETASAFADALVPRIVAAVADRVDVTEMLLERADLDRIVEGVDLDSVAAKLPVDEIVSRVDVDAVVARLDLDALIERLDLVAIAARVIEELDLPEMIRESTGELGTEAIDALRYKSMNADRVLFRWRDRLVTRGDGPASARPPGGPAP